MSLDIMDARSGTLSGNLASGVQFEDSMCHDYVVQEMTGVEEDLLAGKGPIMPRLNQVILNCTVSIGGVSDKKTLAGMVRKLTSVDRMIMLVAIRRASLGDHYRVKYNCPSCTSSNNASVNLSHLEITRARSESETHEAQLSSGCVIEWHTMTGLDEEWLSTQTKRQEKTGRADMLTLAILTRVDSIDGEKIDRRKDLNSALKTVKGLRLSERNELRSIFKEEEGSYDTEIEYECAHCGHEFKADLDVGQATFFFPSGI